MNTTIIAPDKWGYPYGMFLNSPQNHILWVLIRSASVRHNIYFLLRNKKNMDIFQLKKKCPIWELCTTFVFQGEI